ncbi:MAG TPA: helix-turn-helix domain-containing protein [Ignavibacteria bacterium]|nr:helix-turn-helix domain-containing protein [Ignavibacteria bacterium]HRJ99595.1 helix-turn-helix domain-containing protein [Ignavibacteria bacterium]
MVKKKETSGSPDQDHPYRLLSLNAVKKKLRVGYNTIKKWVRYGHIDAIKIDGKYRVPKCKLDDFITRNRTLTSSDVISCEEDELKALAIISNLKKKM